MIFLILRQTERGLLGIFTGIILRNIICFGIDKKLYDLAKAALFILPFLTEGLLYGKINTAFVHLIIICEITFIVHVISRKNVLRCVCGAVSVYASLIVFFMLCSVIPLLLSLFMFDGLNDIFVKFASLPIFLTLTLLANAFIEKSRMGCAFDDKFIRLIALAVCSAIMICITISSITYKAQSSWLTSVVLYITASFLIFIYCAILLFAINEKKKMRIIYSDAEESNTKLIKASAEREEFVIELHRLRKAVGITADTIKMIFDSGFDVPEEFRRNAESFLKTYDQFTEEEKLRAVEIAVPYTTGIPIVDAFLKECACRAARENIEFSAINACPINEIVDNEIMSVMNFHRAVVDLLTNAFHSVECSKTFGKIMFLTGVTPERYYAVDFFDSGNDFSDKVLKNLGKRGNTTDGTGHGLADTLESLRACKASFLIKKLDKEKCGYAKVVKIIFDNKGEVRTE